MEVNCLNLQLFQERITLRPEFHIQKRKELLAQVGDDALLVLFSGRAPRRTADDFYPFFANRSFLYLTGLAMENFTYVAAKRAGEVQEWLFIEEPDEAREVWTGRRMRPDEARQASGIEQILFVENLKSHLHNLIRNADYSRVYLDVDVLEPDQPRTLEQQFAGLLRADYPHLGIDSLFPILRRMRTYKTAEEIANLRAAIQLTGQGLRAILSSCRPGMREYELEAEFKYALARAGCREPSFKPIVSSGSRNFYLHYDRPLGQIEVGDLVLCDVGAAVDGYCADISRVFPAGGRFSPQQLAIYSASLAGVKAAQAVGRPGCTFADFNQAARDAVQEHLARLDLVKEPGDLKKYMWHGLAHHVGLDVHDTGIYDVPFSENMVFTLDVGVYVREWNVGLRIEDNVLVTANGLENLALTAGIPREPGEIEALLAH